MWVCVCCAVCVCVCVLRFGLCLFPAGTEGGRRGWAETGMERERGGRDLSPHSRVVSRSLLAFFHAPAPHGRPPPVCAGACVLARGSGQPRPAGQQCGSVGGERPPTHRGREEGTPPARWLLASTDLLLLSLTAPPPRPRPSSANRRPQVLSPRPPGRQVLGRVQRRQVRAGPVLPGGEGPANVRLWDWFF